MQTLTFTSVQEMSLVAAEYRSKGIAVHSRKQGGEFILEISDRCQPLQTPVSSAQLDNYGKSFNGGVQIDENVFAFSRSKKEAAELSAQQLRSKGKVVNLFLNRKGTAWILKIN